MLCTQVLWDDDSSASGISNGRGAVISTDCPLSHRGFVLPMRSTFSPQVSWISVLHVLRQLVLCYLCQPDVLCSKCSPLKQQSKQAGHDKAWRCFCSNSTKTAVLKMAQQPQQLGPLPLALAQNCIGVMARALASICTDAVPSPLALEMGCA